MTSSTFSVVRSGDRWAVSVDGVELVSARTAEQALETALDAAAILRKGGATAGVKPTIVPSEPKSFAPKD